MKNKVIFSLVVLIYMSPSLFSIIRKLTPGQSSAFEIISVFFILFALIYILGNLDAFRRKLPLIISIPILFFAFIQLFYAILAMFVDVRIGLVAIISRIIPVALSYVSFTAITSKDLFNKFYRFVSLIPICLLPIEILFVLYGSNEFFPIWLRPIEALSYLGRDQRIGIETFVGFFSTPWILSFNLLSILMLGLVKNGMAKIDGLKSDPRVFIASISCLLGIFLSLRRGVLLVAVLCVIIYYLLSSKRLLFRITFIIFALFALVIVLLNTNIFLDNSYSNNITYGNFYFKMDEIDPVARLNSFFMPALTYWYQTFPFGTYLGFAGPEARAFGVLGYQEYNPFVEVGAAQLIAEMGLVGSAIFLLMLIIVYCWLFSKAKSHRYRNIIIMLILQSTLICILYLTKEALVLVNNSMVQFFFWSIPGLAVGILVNTRANNFSPHYFRGHQMRPNNVKNQNIA